MYLAYRYIFQIGQNEHRVELYREYGVDGLHDLAFETESTRIADVRNTLRKSGFEITETQWKVLNHCAKQKYQFIAIDESGKTLESH